MLETLTFTNVIVVLACLLTSMTVHEYMHAYVGFKLGDYTAMERGRISFNPLRHIDPVMTVLLPAITLVLFHAPILAAKPVPFNPGRIKYGDYGAAILAAAGPASNLAMAFIVALLVRFVDMGSFFSQIAVFFVQLNVALAIFNMIPIPPLDGSRVLYSFAPEPVQDLMQQVEPHGFFIILALVLWGGASNVLAYVDNLVLNVLP